MKLKDLPINPTNPRSISEKQLDTLKRSIQRYGDIGGFVYNRNTHRLVCGHQRRKALGDDAEVVITKELKFQDEQGTIARGYVKSLGGVFPYREVLWAEEDEKLASIAANNLTGENDNQLLKEDLLYLDSHNMDLELTGLELDDIEKVLGLKEKKTKEIECPKCKYRWVK